MSSIQIYHTLDHILIRNMILLRHLFEKGNAFFAQGKGHFNRFIFKNQFIGTWKKIFNGLRGGDGLGNTLGRFSVFCFVFHTPFSLPAKIRRQLYESYYCDM